MDCEQLAPTGLDAGVILLVAAVAIILLGAALLLARRSRGAAPAVFAILLLALAAGAAQPALAASSGCVVVPGPTQSISVEQTSVIAGMAPDRAPDAIAGVVTNTGSDDTHIVEVVVSIASISKAPGAAAGTCDASDYVLLAPRMPVDAPLGAGESVAFSGASIGFLDRDVNQNACQGATVALLYRVG